MKRMSWSFRLGLSLVAVAFLLYGVHYAFFGNAGEIALWGTRSLAFLPVSVLLVTLVLNRLLQRRERRIRLEKLNMVIGVFFSEVGTGLLEQFSSSDSSMARIRDDLAVGSGSADDELTRIRQRLSDHTYEVQVTEVRLMDLRSFLLGKREFLVRL